MKLEALSRINSNSEIYRNILAGSNYVVHGQSSESNNNLSSKWFVVSPVAGFRRMSSGLGKAESNGDVSSGGSTSSSDVSTGLGGCWKRRTWSEKMLLLAVVAMFVAFTVATTILVEIYLRLDHRLFKSQTQLTDDVLCNQLTANWTQVNNFSAKSAQ